MSIIHGESSNFDSLINDGIVLVDFYATWCGPCKMLSPVLEEIANDRSSIKIVKIDIDNNQDLTKRFGIMSVPSLLLFKEGRLVSTQTGYMPKQVLVNWIEENK